MHIIMTNTKIHGIGTSYSNGTYKNIGIILIFDRYQNYQSDNRTRFFGYALFKFKVAKVLLLWEGFPMDFYRQLNEREKPLEVTTVLDRKILQVWILKQDINSSETNYELTGTYNMVWR